MIKKIFQKMYPKYQHRWEVYDNLLKSTITNNTVWLDIGCGKNELVAKYGQKAKKAIGIDLLDEKDRVPAPFLQSDLRHIPLESGYANLVTLRMVVEHLEKIPEDFSEVVRLLVPGGKLIILTTNALSPIIFIPRLLPYRMKSWIIQKTFQVDSREIFPTHHRFNTKKMMTTGIQEMELIQLEFLEQVPFHRPFLTLLFGIWYAIVDIHKLKFFRSNLLAVFQKTSA